MPSMTSISQLQLLVVAAVASLSCLYVQAQCSADGIPRYTSLTSAEYNSAVSSLCPNPSANFVLHDHLAVHCGGSSEKTAALRLSIANGLFGGADGAARNCDDICVLNGEGKGHFKYDASGSFPNGNCFRFRTTGMCGDESSINYAYDRESRLCDGVLPPPPPPPSPRPTASPQTSSPTSTPTSSPRTSDPTPSPTGSPQTSVPSASPTSSPTDRPTYLALKHFISCEFDCDEQPLRVRARRTHDPTEEVVTQQTLDDFSQNFETFSVIPSDGFEVVEKCVNNVCESIEDNKATNAPTAAPADFSRRRRRSRRRLIPNQRRSEEPIEVCPNITLIVQLSDDVEADQGVSNIVSNSANGGFTIPYNVHGVELSSGISDVATFTRLVPFTGSRSPTSFPTPSPSCSDRYPDGCSRWDCSYLWVQNYCPDTCNNPNCDTAAPTPSPTFICEDVYPDGCKKWDCRLNWVQGYCPQSCVVPQCPHGRTGKGKSGKSRK